MLTGIGSYEDLKRGIHDFFLLHFFWWSGGTLIELWASPPCYLPQPSSFPFLPFYYFMMTFRLVLFIFFPFLLERICTIRALDPTLVRIEAFESDCETSTSDWILSNVPETVDPETPTFTFGVSKKSAETMSFENNENNNNRTFDIRGSLGLKNHPLGIFKFEASGLARDEQKAYVYDGILGDITLNFPASSSIDDIAPVFAFDVNVRVFTVIPSIPPLVSTGFQVILTVSDDLCAKISLSQPASSGAEKGQDVCLTDSTPDLPSYPPASELVNGRPSAIPRYNISLDDAPADRWTDVVAPLSTEIQALIDTFMRRNHSGAHPIYQWIIEHFGESEMRRIPAIYREEIEGISKATGINVGELWVMNMMYELEGYCTSIVAKGANGTIWHGRNLDFGLFMGADNTTHNWALTPRLRDVLVDISFTRGGAEVYRSVTFAGFVGLLTGSKTGSFSLSVDTRFDANLDKGILEWIVLGKNQDCHFLTFTTRDVIENNATYADALRTLVNYMPLGPAYIIVGDGGGDVGGAVVTKQFVSESDRETTNSTVDVWQLSDAIESGSYYVLETNYDRVKPPPDFDDRRYPAMNCLDSLEPGAFGPSDLWTVMSSNPTRNAMTTFTSLMSPTTGHFEAYVQFCAPGPHCAPF